MSAFVQENRIVCYLAPTRIVWQSKGTVGARRLMDVAGETATIWRKPGLQLPPGGSVILEYDTELPLQGIRISRGYDTTPPRPVQVRIRLGESVSEVMNDPNNDHSMHDITMPVSAMGISRVGNTGFRFLNLTNLDSEATLNLRECSAEVWAHPAKRIGYFECSDQRLNDIYNACVATLTKCISPLLLDGTKRDRLVWMGDLYNEIRACGVLFQKHSAIPESLDFLSEEALVNKYFNGIPSYTAYWFLGQREYYRFFADAKYLQKQHKNFLFFAELLLKSYEKNPGEIMKGTIVDWGMPERTPANSYGPLFLAGVQACQDLASMLGEDAVAQRCQKVENDLKARFDLSLCPKSAAAWAALTGLATAKEVYDKILSQDPEKYLSTFHFENFLRVYTAAGETKKGLDLLRKYYGGMLKLGATTIWEQYDLDWAPGATPIDQLPKPGRPDIHRDCGSGCFTGYRNSLCHGWGASPIAWMMENLAGITPIGDGYSRGVRVAPNLCGLDYVAAICPTPAGPVTLLARKGEPIIVEAPKGMKVKKS